MAELFWFMMFLFCFQTRPDLVHVNVIQTPNNEINYSVNKGINNTFWLFWKDYSLESKSQGARLK